MAQTTKVSDIIAQYEGKCRIIEPPNNSTHFYSLGIAGIKNLPLKEIPMLRYAYASGISIFLFTLMFCCLYFQKNVPAFIAVPIAASLAITCVFCFTFSLKFRCICLLSLPTLSSQQGRNLLLVAITGLLVGGPLTSITYNISEAAHTISCVSEMAINQSRAQRDAYITAYIEMLRRLNDTIQVWKDTAAMIRSGIEPISNALKSGVELFGKAVTVLNNVRDSCQTQMRNVYAKCSEGAREVKSDCEKALNSNPFTSISTSICGMFDAATKTCSIFKDSGADVMCRPVTYLGTTVENSLKISLQTLHRFSEAFNVRVNLDQSIETMLNASKSSKQIKKAITDEFSLQINTIKFIFEVIQYVLILTLILVPLQAIRYLRIYLKQRGSEPKCLKVEKTQRKADKKAFIMQMFSLMIHFCLSSAMFSFDYILYWIESTVKKHGNNTITTFVHVDIDLKVTGGDIMGTLMQEFLNSFKSKNNHTFAISSSECLPSPMEPNGLSFIIPIALVYFLIVAFALLNARYFSKLKTNIIALCYPIAENK